MPRAAVPVQMSADARQFARASARLKAAGRRDLQLRVGRAIRAAARPVVAATRANYLGLEDVSPARRPGPQARATIAAAVRLELRATGPNPQVRIFVDLRRVPEDMRALVRAWERGRWRHPVFANPEQTRRQWRWVTQEVRPPFRRAVQGHERVFREAVDTAVRDALRELDRSG